MALANRRIDAHMTPLPHTVGREQVLSFAAKRMEEHDVRHLPILHGGELVGVLSDRDVAIIESLPGVRADEITVEEAMSMEPYHVAPDADLVEVAKTMAEHKYGCAVVMDGTKVVGIFTTNDALRLLAELA